MRRQALLLTLALPLAACRSEQDAQLQAQLGEVRAETERLTREVDDLRRRLPSDAAAQPSAAPAAGGAHSEKLQALDATLGGLLEQLAPRGELATGQLAGVWRATTSEGMQAQKGPRTVSEEVLHLTDDGRLCGYRLVGSGPFTKEPFWGRWQLRGGFLVELRDRWVGDHNETDGVVRRVSAEHESFTLQGDGTPRRFTHVPESDWKGLASLYTDRIAPIPGLPAWCFQGAK